MSFFTNHNPNNSFEVAQPPTDSVSSLSFSPKSNLMVSTSWDNQVRCWDVQKIGTSIAATPKSSYSHDHASQYCAQRGKMMGWLCSLEEASWDKTLKYWDLRQPNPVHTQLLPERCYALTVKYPLMVVGTADRNLIMFNLHNPQTEFKRIISPLKYQTRCVAAFPDQQGFLVGSIEGRVGVQHLNERQESKNFTFKCHRENNVIYSVNSINFHPVHHTFATAGSDGSISFWDKDSKQRLKAMSKCNQPIPCSTFNNDGSIFAYSVCYDWHKGAGNHNPSIAKTSIFLHLPQDADVKPKPKPAGRG
ncbi:hypothetical protein ACLB2K_049265 [Fragaria x ananassa]